MDDVFRVEVGGRAKVVVWNVDLRRVVVEECFGEINLMVSDRGPRS